MARDKICYILDTSAILAFFENEKGADVVERILMEARAKKADVFASFMSYMEAYCRVYENRGKEEALKMYLYLESLPVERVDMDDRILLLAGAIKAKYHLSVADSWIIATAKAKGGKLVHKDPSFKKISGEVSLLSLPYT